MANIGKSITIKGDLTGNEDLVIEGKVEGRVELPNNQLTVGANGVVKAEVSAKTVVVIGKRGRQREAAASASRSRPPASSKATWRRRGWWWPRAPS